MHSFHTSALYEGDVSFAAHVLRIKGITWAFDSNGNVLETPIPSVYEPGSFRKEWLDRDIKILEELKAMTLADAKAKIRALWREENREYHRSVIDMNARWYRYQRMLTQLEAWDAPGLLIKYRLNLISELKEAISREIYPIQPPSPQPDAKTWLAECIEQRTQDIQRHEEQAAKERAKAEERTYELQLLLKSLNLRYSEELVPTRTS